MEVSRAPAAPEQPAEPFEITGPHMTGLLVLKATLAIFIGDISNVALKVTKTAVAHRSTPTFNFDGGVGWRSHLEGVDTHVHSGVVSSWFVQPAEQKHTSHEPTAGC